MVGIATLTMKASTPNMNCAATTIASTHQRREVSSGVETIWCIGSGLDSGNRVRRMIPAFGHGCDYLAGKDRHGFWPDCCMARAVLPGISSFTSVRTAADASSLDA